MRMVTVRRLCNSDAHEESRILIHRKEVLDDGRIKYTCTICGEVSLFEVEDELAESVQLTPRPVLDGLDNLKVPVVRRHKKHRRKRGISFTDQQLIDLHAEGLLDQEIAERLGVARSTVSQRRRNLGIESSMPRISRQRFLELYEMGLNDAEIAIVLGVTDSGVCNYRKRQGLASNWEGTPLSFTDQQFLDLYEEGLNDPRIAEILGVVKSTVRSRRHKFGLKGHGYVRRFTDEEFIALHREGLSDAKKAERFGVSEGMIFYHRQRLGLKPNRGRRKALP